MSDKVEKNSQDQSRLDNIAIILVETLHPANIGATCRAMKNMGLSDLRLVHPPLDRNNEAVKLAHGATEILESAKRVFTLDEALEDIQFVVGTTARLGGWRAKVPLIKNAAPEILNTAQNNKVAILFGSEDRGLSNETIARCQALTTIPSTKVHRSLNISQAVLVVAYELYVAEFPKDSALPQLASVSQVEAMFEDLTDSLKIINYLKPGNPEYWMMSFKRLLGRTGLTDGEVNMMRGICRQIRWLNSKVPPEDQVDTK